MSNETIRVRCPRCGREFKQAKNGRVPTHRLGVTARRVGPFCNGGGMHPKAPDERVAWVVEYASLTGAWVFHSAFSTADDAREVERHNNSLHAEPLFRVVRYAPSPSVSEAHDPPPKRTITPETFALAAGLAGDEIAREAARKYLADDETSPSHTHTDGKS